MAEEVGLIELRQNGALRAASVVDFFPIIGIIFNLILTVITVTVMFVTDRDGTVDLGK